MNTNCLQSWQTAQLSPTSCKNDSCIAADVPAGNAPEKRCSAMDFFCAAGLLRFPSSAHNLFYTGTLELTSALIWDRVLSWGNLRCAWRCWVCPHAPCPRRVSERAFCGVSPVSPFGNLACTAQCAPRHAVSVPGPVFVYICVLHKIVCKHTKSLIDTKRTGSVAYF